MSRKRRSRTPSSFRRMVDDSHLGYTMVTALERSLDSFSPPFVVVVGLLMMTLIGLVDAITGPLAVGIFYLVPIGLVTYARGRWVGTLMAAAADKLRAPNELRAALNEEEQAKPDRLQAMVELRRVNSQAEIAVASF